MLQQRQREPSSRIGEFPSQSQLGWLGEVYTLLTNIKTGQSTKQYLFASRLRGATSSGIPSRNPSSIIGGKLITHARTLRQDFALEANYLQVKGYLIILAYKQVNSRTLLLGIPGYAQITELAFYKDNRALGRASLDGKSIRIIPYVEYRIEQGYKGVVFLVVARDRRVFERVGIARLLLVNLTKFVVLLKAEELEEIILRQQSQLQQKYYTQRLTNRRRLRYSKRGMP